MRRYGEYKVVGFGGILDYLEGTVTGLIVEDQETILSDSCVFGMLVKVLYPS